MAGTFFFPSLPLDAALKTHLKLFVHFALQDRDGRNVTRSTSPSPVDEDDAFRGGFYSWFLGGAHRTMGSSSFGVGVGVGTANAYSPPGKRYMTYGDENRWRDGVF